MNDFCQESESPVFVAEKQLYWLNQVTGKVFFLCLTLALGIKMLEQKLLITARQH
jgi:hypothetical protein